MEVFDVAVIGSGPAGSTCATLAARSGKRVLLIDRALFPREKVCGDCLNPRAWPVIKELGLEQRIRALSHAQLTTVRFETTTGTGFDVPLPRNADGSAHEIAIRRSLLDALLLEQATNTRGVTVRQDETLRALARTGSVWAMDTTNGSHFAKTLVAADGRNSTVCRLLRIAPAMTVGRVGLGTHAHLKNDIYSSTVLLRLLEGGYMGLAPIGDGLTNICVVATPPRLRALRTWSEDALMLDPDTTTWHSVAPLSRKPVAPVPCTGLYVIGDAARVVEPFTGEGITYALQTGSLAARAIANSDPAAFTSACRALYKKSLWVNHLSRLAVTRPRIGNSLLLAARSFPALLPALTAKVVT